MGSSGYIVGTMKSWDLVEDPSGVRRVRNSRVDDSKPFFGSSEGHQVVICCRHELYVNSSEFIIAIQ
jgi:hypothetical protein